MDHFFNLLLVDDHLSVRQSFCSDNLAVSDVSKIVLGAVDKFTLQSFNLSANITSIARS